MDIPLSLFSLSMHGDLSFVLFVCAKNERAPVLVLGPILIFFLKKYDQVCGPKCAEGARHQAECKLLAGQEHPTYAPVIATY